MVWKRKVLLATMFALYLSSEGVLASKNTWARLKQLPLINKLVEAQGGTLAQQAATILLAIGIACTGIGCGDDDERVSIWLEYDDYHKTTKEVKALPHSSMARIYRDYTPGETVLFDHRGTDELGSWHGVVQRVIRYEKDIPAYNPASEESMVIEWHSAIEVETVAEQKIIRLEDDWILGLQLTDSDRVGKQIDIYSNRDGVQQRHAVITGHYHYVRPATVIVNGIATETSRKGSRFYKVRVTHETRQDGTLADLEPSYFDYVFEDGTTVPRFADFLDNHNAIDDFDHNFIENNN